MLKTNFSYTGMSVLINEATIVMSIELVNDQIAKVEKQLAKKDITVKKADALREEKATLENEKATLENELSLIKNSSDEVLKTIADSGVSEAEAKNIFNIARVIACAENSKFSKIAISEDIFIEKDVKDLYASFETILSLNNAGAYGMNKADKAAYKMASEIICRVVRAHFSIPMVEGVCGKMTVRLSKEDLFKLNTAYAKGIKNTKTTKNEETTISFDKFNTAISCRNTKNGTVYNVSRFNKDLCDVILAIISAK